MQYFEYGTKEIEYLSKKDQRLAEAIKRIGMIKREVKPDIFAALVHSIVGQQISTKAGDTIYNRMRDVLKEITPQKIHDCLPEEIQSFGISYKKAGYIKNAAEKVLMGEFNQEALQDASDEYVCRELSSLDGIGVWTAQMLMLFSMQRLNVLSYGDLAIHRGLRMLYHHRKIDKKLFEKYRRRYYPYGSVASLYLWEIAGGAIPGMKDYAPKKTKGKKVEIKA